MRTLCYCSNPPRMKAAFWLKGKGHCYMTGYQIKVHLQYLFRLSTLIIFSLCFIWFMQSHLSWLLLLSFIHLSSKPCNLPMGALSGNGARRQRKLSRMKIFTRFNISHDLQLSLCGYTSWYSLSKIDLICL